jgi:hypothetical protein
MPTLVQEKPTLTPNSQQSIPAEEHYFPVDINGQNQAGPNSFDMLSGQLEAVEQPQVPAVQVREFQDKHGHTRYMKQGVNAETGYKFTSFISKTEADKLLAAQTDDKQAAAKPTFELSAVPEHVQRAFDKVDAEEVEDIRDNRTTDETLNEIIQTTPAAKANTSTGKTPLTDDIEETSGEHIAIGSDAQDAVLTVADKGMYDEMYEKTGYEPQHLKQKESLRNRARKFLGKVITGTSVYLGLAPHPNQAVTKLPPNYSDKIQNQATAEPETTPQPAEVAAQLPPTEVRIRAERAGEPEENKAA